VKLIWYRVIRRIFRPKKNEATGKRRKSHNEQLYSFIVKLSLCLRWGKNGTVLLISNTIGTRWREWSTPLSHSSTPRDRIPGTHWIWGYIGPEPVLIIWRSEKFLAPARIQTLNHPAHSLVTYIPTMLSWLPHLLREFNSKENEMTELWSTYRRNQKGTHLVRKNTEKRTVRPREKWTDINKT
jgi:hypothetical protein